MVGDVILEAGSGSGRFTVQAASTGAMVVSFDYSNAVEANYRNNGHFDNVLIVQASIFEMPFRDNSFSRVFCIGVIQHTPDPWKAFQCLTKVLRSGGNIVIDAYRIRPWYEMIFLTKYWVRPITKKMPNDMLYRFCEKWVNFWWGITGIFVNLTGRRMLSWFLLIADYRGVLPLPDELQREWSILDTFDMLSPAYDYPQTLASVRGWFEEEGYREVDVQYGYNGIEGRGIKI
jgi:ubiquinone/menaquinone biosynthesis C-methylase UbiE